MKNILTLCDNKIFDKIIIITCGETSEFCSFTVKHKKYNL